MRTVQRLVFFSLAAALVGIGCDDGDDGPCTIPLGTYTMEVSSVGGDCDTRIVSGMTAMRQDITINEESDCGAIRVSQTEPIEGTECMMSFVLTVNGTRSGLEDGDMTLDITNCGDDNCHHEFNLWLEGH